MRASFLEDGRLLLVLLLELLFALGGFRGIVTTIQHYTLPGWKSHAKNNVIPVDIEIATNTVDDWVVLAMSSISSRKYNNQTS